MREYFQVCVTDAQGNPLGAVERLNDKREILAYFSLRCPRMDLKALRHFIELARVAPDGPGVDVTHWEDGRMLFSARLVHHAQAPEALRTGF